MELVITIILSSLVILMLIEEIFHLAFKRYINGPFISEVNLKSLIRKVFNKEEKAPIKKDFFSQ
ncbi:hypothetical protein AF332_05215 [Sporosarcina globispora]|uniref:Uncharacterized protein n=1 Tax=Sporosarcina globispora TaxID=1459 RepID=A0A0M0G931_SPOGL|nr:hypothetical protein [Sporosarcina globispora]KON86278.1 hypothetical protein AF332_05215 [Sporosarcina globispora]